MCCFFKNEETQILAWIITDCILNIFYGFLLFFMLDDLIGSPGGIVGPIWSFTVISSNKHENKFSSKLYTALVILLCQKQSD